MYSEFLCKRPFKGMEELRDNYIGLKLRQLKGKRKGIILTITGASAAGKDSLVDALLYLNNIVGLSNCKSVANLVKGIVSKNNEITIRELISHTTRAPRDGEVNHVDYHFISREEFDNLDKVESTEYAGNYYCLSADELRKILDIGVVIVDKNGVKCIHDYVEKHSDEYIHLSVFLRTDEEHSRERMIARGDKSESIEKRLKQQKERNEYSPEGFDFSIVLDSNNEADMLYNALYIQEMLDFVHMIAYQADRKGYSVG